MWYIYLNGECRGTAVYAEDAAGFVSFLGDGAQVRTRSGRVVWQQGDSFDGDAGESYDAAAELMQLRAAEQPRKAAR